jgi:hypothetical protein
MAIPSRRDHIETSLAEGVRTDQLIFNRGALDVRVLHSDWPIEITAFATDDDPLGRGDRGAIPLHLMLDTKKGVRITPSAPRKWEIEVTLHSAAPISGG